MQAGALPLRSCIKGPLSAPKWRRVHDWTGWTVGVLIKRGAVFFSTFQHSCLAQTLSKNHTLLKCCQFGRFGLSCRSKNGAEGEALCSCRDLHTCQSTVSDGGAEPMASFKSLVLRNELCFKLHQFLSWVKCSNVREMAEYFFTQSYAGSCFLSKRSRIWLNDADTRKQEVDETAALAPPQINDEQ